MARPTAREVWEFLLVTLVFGTYGAFMLQMPWAHAVTEIVEKGRRVPCYRPHIYYNVGSGESHPVPNPERRPECEVEGRAYNLRLPLTGNDLFNVMTGTTFAGLVLVVIASIFAVPLYVGCALLVREIPPWWGASEDLDPGGWKYRFIQDLDGRIVSSMHEYFRERRWALKRTEGPPPEGAEEEGAPEAPEGPEEVKVV